MHLCALMQDYTQLHVSHKRVPILTSQHVGGTRHVGASDAGGRVRGCAVSSAGEKWPPSNDRGREGKPASATQAARRHRATEPSPPEHVPRKVIAWSLPPSPHARPNERAPRRPPHHRAQGVRP